MKTATEKYNAVLEGKMAKQEFVRQMRQQFPNFVSQFNGFEDSVQILKNKGMIFEVKKEEGYKVPELNLSLDVIERGIDAELEAAGIDSAGNVTKEQYLEAKRKAMHNLKKDMNHYLNLMAGESSTVDKNDEMREVKKGEEKDVFNGMKKAELKENTDIDSARENIVNVASVIRAKYSEIPGFNVILKDFLQTHQDDIKAGLVTDPVAEFDNYIDLNFDRLNEQPIEEEPNEGNKYEYERLKAIKHGKDTFTVDGKTEKVKGVDADDKERAADIKEAVKTIIRKVLTEDTLNEAATARLAQYGEEYSDFDGVKQIVNQLENIVTEVESFYDRINNKVKDIFEKVGEVRNEEGLKVGGFIAPSIEAAFRNDLKPVQKNFLVGIELPKVKTISQADIARVNAGGELEEEPKQNVFAPVYESKKKN